MEGISFCSPGHNGDVFAYSVAEDRQKSMATRLFETPTAVAREEHRQKRGSSRRRKRLATGDIHDKPRAGKQLRRDCVGCPHRIAVHECCRRHVRQQYSSVAIGKEAELYGV